MAKLSIMGDTVQITTDLTKEVIKRVEDYFPEALKLFDTEGNEVFGVAIGNASFSKYGICFCSETAEGKMFMTTNNPVLDHSDPAKEREKVVRCFARVLNDLKQVEANVQEVKAELDGIEESIQESVTFVG